MSKLQIKTARSSFPRLFTAEDYQGNGRFAYKITLLVPAVDDGECMVRKDLSDDPTVTKWGPWMPARKAIDDAILETAKAKWAAKAQAVLNSIEGIPQNICWLDGKRKALDGYEGNWALTASRPQDKGRPLVLDANKAALTEKDGKPYAGCYVNATFSFWPQDNTNGKGLRCELISVQFAKDGDSFSAGGIKGSEDDFEDVSAGATADDLV